MVSLYGEIKSYVARLKTLLNKMLDEEINGMQHATKSDPMIITLTKEIIRFLVTFGDDRGHLKI